MANGRKLNEVTNVSTLASSDRIVTVRTSDGKTVQISLTDFMNTLPAGSIITATVGDEQITDAKLEKRAALSVMGNATNATEAPADITAGSDNTVLKRDGNSLAFGKVKSQDIDSQEIKTGNLDNKAVTTGKLDDNAVTPAKSARLGFRTVTANTTLALGDVDGVVEVNSSSARTITVPTNASVALPVGTVIEIVKWSTGSVTVSPQSGVTLYSPDGETGARAIASRYGSAFLRKRNTNEWHLTGDLE